MGLSALREMIPKPITLHILNLFYHLLNVKYFGNKDSLMVWAAMALAFFGFLRIGELTGDSHFNLESHLFIFRPIKGFQNRPI